MKKILVFGGSGLVGSKFIELYSQNFEIDTPDVVQLDILNKDQVSKKIEQFNPDTVINFAAFTSVKAAEDQKGDKNGICFQINAMGAKNVANATLQFNKHLIHISTEYVFDGTKEASPYTEDDKPNPVNWYGQTKYFGEQFVLESDCQVALVRICMPFSPFYELKKDVARYFLGELQKGNEITAIEDQKITPTIVSDIANTLKVLIETGKVGIYHVCSTDFTTPYEFARMIAAKFNLDINLVKPISFDEYNKEKLAKLLKNSWLDPSLFINDFGQGILHKVEEALDIFKVGVDGNGQN